MEANMNNVLAEAAQKIIDEHEKYKNVELERLPIIAEAYKNLVDAGVNGLPTLDVYALRGGFTVEVKDPEQWGKIHKAVGELECWDKRPMGKDARNKNIMVVMTPKNVNTNYWVKFSFVRKLDETDKCTVKTKLRRETYVECQRN